MTTSLKLLIIDPDNEFRAVLLLWFEHLGHDTRAIGRLTESANAHCEWHPDVVFVCTELLANDSAIEATLDHEGRRRPYVVGMTTERFARLPRRSCDCVIEKPFDAEVILDEIQRRLTAR